MTKGKRKLPFPYQYFCKTCGMRPTEEVFNNNSGKPCCPICRSQLWYTCEGCAEGRTNPFPYKHKKEHKNCKGVFDLSQLPVHLPTSPTLLISDEELVLLQQLSEPIPPQVQPQLPPPQLQLQTLYDRLQDQQTQISKMEQKISQMEQQYKADIAELQAVCTTQQTQINTLLNNYR